MSNTTVRPKPNPHTAFLQMQKAQAEKAKPYTTESPDYKVEAPKPTLATTGEPVDTDNLMAIDPELDIHDLDGITMEEIAATDAELTAPSDRIDDGTWQDETRPEFAGIYRSSWLCTAAEVGMGNWNGRLRQFVDIDPRDPMDALNDDEFVGFHAARA